MVDLCFLTGFTLKKEIRMDSARRLFYGCVLLSLMASKKVETRISLSENACCVVIRTY